MTLEDFCKRIANIKELSNAQKAVSILWFLDNKEVGVKKTSGELAGIIRDNYIGNPNPTILAKQIKSTGCVYSSKSTFYLRGDMKAEVRSWVETVLVGIHTEVPLESQFLDEKIWKSTRRYIEKVCIQLNGSYHEGYYDCAAVMLRRIIETLIIEAFKELKRSNEIKGSDNNYFMLGKLVSITNGKDGLDLVRDAKKGLEEIKKLGDHSAHNRRYIAKKSDIDRIKNLFRVAFEDLANLANLYS